MQFEWDEEKRQANLEKHDVDFRDVGTVFRGPNLTYSSPAAGERRRVAIGRLHPPGRPDGWSDPLVAAFHTKREETYRIISARRARTDERQICRNLLG